MSLSVRQTGIFHSTDLNVIAGPLYTFVRFNRDRSHICDNKVVKLEDQRAHPRIDWHENHDNQSGCRQTRTASDHAFSHSAVGDIAADSAAGECLAVEQDNCADFYDHHLTRVKDWSEYTLKSTPEGLFLLAGKSASLHPEPSTDSVFEDNCVEAQRAEGELSNNSALDGRLFPSTASTEFSLSGSVNDTASQPELCNVDLSEKEVQGNGRIITLADYLNSLGDSDSSSRLLKPVPTLANIRRMTGLAAPVSEPVLQPLRTLAPYPYPQHQQQQQSSDLKPAVFMTEITSESAIKPMSNGLPVPTSDGSMSGTNLPKPVMDPTDYLLKRRAFLLERLVERYDELMKLMNEELELTGLPPKNYLESVNEYKASKEALRKLMASRRSCKQKSLTEDVNSMENTKPNKPESGGQPVNLLANTTSLPASNNLPTTRLQQTGFMLSPKLVRQVSLKLSPSANNLLKSQLSLCNYDTQSVGEPEPTDKRPPFDHCPVHPGGQSRSQSVSKSTPRGSRRSNLMDSWSKRKQAISNRVMQNKFRTGEKGLGSAQLSMSLSDLAHGTGRGHVDADVNVPEDHLPGLVKNSDSFELDNTKRRASVTSVASCPLNEVETSDREQAIAWIDIQLHAVRKILEANRLCAAESKRKKAYQLACQKNEETIAQLERQKAFLLQSNRHSDTDKASINCSSHTGDSVESSLDPPAYDHHTTSDCDATDSISSNGSAWEKLHNRRRLTRTAPVERSSQNMIDGLRKLIPTVKSVTGPRTNSSRSVSPRLTSQEVEELTEIDSQSQATHSNQTPSKQEEEAVGHSPNKNKNNDMNQQTTNLTEPSASIRIINQIVPVYHQRILTLDGFDEMAQLPTHTTTTTTTTPFVLYGGDLSRIELSCDTGLGNSLVYSVHTESGSDLSRWSGASMETRSISSAEQTTDMHNPKDRTSHTIQPWLFSCSTSNTILSDSSTTERSNNFVRVCYDEQQHQQQQSQQQRQHHHHHHQQLPLTSSPFQTTIQTSHGGKAVAFIPRINTSQIVKPGGRETQETESEQVVLCSRLPAYRNESSHQTRTISPMNGGYSDESRSRFDQTISPLPRAITTVRGDTVFRRPVRLDVPPTEIHRCSPERVIAVDRPLGNDFHSTGTQTNRAAYTVLPKLPGSVSSAWSSNRLGSRNADQIATPSCHRISNHKTHNNSGMDDCGSPILSIRVQPHLPGRESTVSPLCAYSITTPTAERKRLMVHSQSGELLSPHRHESQISKLTKSSSSAMVASPHCIRRSESVRRVNASRRSKSTDPALTWFRTEYPWDRVRSP